MAGVTVCTGGAAFELAAVNVFVAIAAQGMRYGGAEIIVLVALRAGSFGMLPVQRKFGRVVIKTTVGDDRFPPRRRVAILAGALERCRLKSSAVRIGMTILAVGKG